jgi:hypothetical protein
VSGGQACQHGGAVIARPRFDDHDIPGLKFAAVINGPVDFFVRPIVADVAQNGLRLHIERGDKKGSWGIVFDYRHGWLRLILCGSI